MSTLLAQRSLVRPCRGGGRRAAAGGLARAAARWRGSSAATPSGSTGRRRPRRHRIRSPRTSPTAWSRRLFWGPGRGPAAGILAYKAINTLDSMVGHRSERYRDFGWASARLDDLVNLVPARLTGAPPVPRRRHAAPRRCGSCGATRRRHRSPNAGWPEAAMAAALGLRLAGPRVYGGRDGRGCAGWATAAPRSRPADIERGDRAGLARLVAARSRRRARGAGHCLA